MKSSRPGSLQLVALVTGGFLALVLLGGCAQRAELAKAESSAFTAGAPAPSAAPSSERAAADQAASNAALPARLPSQRMVIRTAGLDVRVRDVKAAFARAVQLTETRGGYVQSSSQETSGGDTAWLTLRVGPEAFLPLLASLAGLGTPLSKSISGEDVTEEYYDLDAQLGNLTAVRTRLLALLGRATKVTDAVEVERELERVGGELNRIEGRMRYLTTMVGLSTINLTLSTEERPAVEAFINWALVGNGFVVAARTLVQALFFILQAIVVVVPIAAAAAAAAFGIWRLVRWLRGRGGAPAKAAGRAAQSRRR